MRGYGKASIDLSNPSWLAALHVVQERQRQDAQYGAFNATLGPSEWLSVLAREFCEAGNEANEMYKGRVTDPAKLRAELVQLAAVAVAWVEAIDARPAEPENPCQAGTCNHACGCISST